MVKMKETYDGFPKTIIFEMYLLANIARRLEALYIRIRYIRITIFHSELAIYRYNRYWRNYTIDNDV